MSPWHVAGLVLGLLGAAAQVIVALLGDAIGGMSVAVVVLAVDAVVAAVGAILIPIRPTVGAAVLGAAGIGAIVALFSTTLLEIGVAVLLLGAAAAVLVGTATPKRANP